MKKQIVAVIAIVSMLCVGAFAMVGCNDNGNATEKFDLEQYRDAKKLTLENYASSMLAEDAYTDSNKLVVKDCCQTGIRTMGHTIIHEDATPSTTASEITLYIEVCKFFINETNNFLEKSLNEINAL